MTRFAIDRVLRWDGRPCIVEDLRERGDETVRVRNHFADGSTMDHTIGFEQWRELVEDFGAAHFDRVWAMFQRVEAMRAEAIS